jgi:hypothetical protein
MSTAPAQPTSACVILGCPNLTAPQTAASDLRLTLRHERAFWRYQPGKATGPVIVDRCLVIYMATIHGNALALVKWQLVLG